MKKFIKWYRQLQSDTLSDKVVDSITMINFLHMWIILSTMWVSLIALNAPVVGLSFGIWVIVSIYTHSTNTLPLLALPFMVIKRKIRNFRTPVIQKSTSDLKQISDEIETILRSSQDKLLQLNNLGREYVEHKDAYHNHDEQEAYISQVSALQAHIELASNRTYALMELHYFAQTALGKYESEQSVYKSMEARSQKLIALTNGNIDLQNQFVALVDKFEVTTRHLNTAKEIALIVGAGKVITPTVHHRLQALAEVSGDDLKVIVEKLNELK